MASSLKKSLKNYYEDITLSKNQLDELMELQSSQKKLKLSKLAVSLLLVASLFFLVINKFPIFHNSIKEKIIEEVVYNHNKQVEPEILTDSIVEIQTKLNRLDFNLVQPSKIASANWLLIGGRYCSIQGKIAAQLKIKNRKSNIVYTLYEWPLQKSWDRDTIIGSSEAINGVIVDIWWEQGLLFALAGPE